MNSRRAWAATAVAAACLCTACGGSEIGAPAGAPAAAPHENATGAAKAAASVAVADDRPRIVVLGDSLTAGLGLSAADAFPSLLQQRVDAADLQYQVVNAGVSGDTSAGGLSRLDWALGDNAVRLLIVALGGNDGLRGLPAKELEQNLATIIERAQAKHLGVILAGMEAPPNFGQSYVVSFHQVFPDLAARYHVALVPFLLRGVAGIDSLNQRDGIHPTAAGARIVADNVWAVLRPMIESQGH